MQPATAPEPDRSAAAIIESVEQLDAFLADDPRKHVTPPRGLEQRFFDASPTLSRLRVITHFYGTLPARQRNPAHYQKPGGAKRALAYLKTYEQAFGHISRAHGGTLFSGGRVKRFLDMGCSPGGFSNWLLEHNWAATGVGMTLPDAQAQWKMITTGTHLEGPRYDLRFADIVSVAMAAVDNDETPVIPPRHGSDGGGAAGFDLVVAGAFPSMDEGIHLTTRVQLALGQLLVLLHNLMPGGTAVVVLTTRVHRWVVEELALLRRCFARVSTGKGRDLHQERSSCYLVCTDFCATEESIAAYSNAIRDTLRHVKKTQAELDAGEDDQAWRKLLTLVEISGKTEEELFESERQVVLDLFEPLWQEQYEAKYTKLVQFLSNAHSDSPHKPRGRAFRGRGTTRTKRGAYGPHSSYQS